MRRKLWAFYATIAGTSLAIAGMLAGRLRWVAIGATLAIGAGIATRTWTRQFPGPMPYSLRWVLHLPRGPHSPRRLTRILEPRSGQRMLEVGPGIGVHALPVATALAPDGRLDVLDVQREMLDELMRRASAADVTNIVTACTDANRLPYGDHVFDAAFLIAVLGETADGIQALRELRRVLKPEGRLVVGEVAVDPDFISSTTLTEMAKKAGFALERVAGPRWSYLALFRPSSS